MPLRARHWSVAWVAALTIHALGLLLFWQPAPSGARSPGLGGIEVALGPVGGAPGAVPAAVQPVEANPPPPVETVQPVEAVEAPPEVVEVVAEAIPVEAAPVVKPPPAPQPRPRPVPTAVPTTVPAPVETVSPVEAVVQAPPQAVAAAPGADGRAGSQDAREAGEQQAATGGGLPGHAASYFDLLRAWLEKHKEYPRDARLRRSQGTVLLWFEIDRDGNVLGHRITGSSGHAALDREVDALIRRAAPLPAMPPEMSQARLALVVPVEFRLK